eukprot:m.45533 g.45533  ORF g.45533 m.45533 type:complete len:69 (-) comp7227_c0_seq1:2858-3064(-)
MLSTPIVCLFVFVSPPFLLSFSTSEDGVAFVSEDGEGSALSEWHSGKYFVFFKSLVAHISTVMERGLL